MSTTSPNIISVFRSSTSVIGFLRSAGPRGWGAYDSSGALVGMFKDKRAAVEAITAITSTGE